MSWWTVVVSLPFLKRDRPSSSGAAVSSIPWLLVGARRSRLQSRHKESADAAMNACRRNSSIV